jgi:hypothetical protein
MEFSDHLTFDTIGLGISKVGGDNLLLNFRSASDRPDQLLAKERPHVPDFHARARGDAFGVDRHARCERCFSLISRCLSMLTCPANSPSRDTRGRGNLYAGE